MILPPRSMEPHQDPLVEEILLSGAEPFHFDMFCHVYMNTEQLNRQRP